MQNCLQCLSIAYRLWTEKDRALTKALIYHEKVVYKWKPLAGWEQASKTHSATPLPKKKIGSQEIIWEENQSKYNHSFLPWSADELLESPKGHPNHLKNTICYLLSLKRCLDFFHCLNVTLSTSFPVIFHSISRLGFFFSCCSLTEQVISKRPSELSVPIVTGHYLITPPWSDLMSSASQYTQLCQNGPGFEVWRFKGGPDLRGRSCWTEWHIAALHSQAANIWRGDGQL